MDYIIRKKRRDDCTKVAHVVTQAWNETYKGLVKEDFLKGLYNNESYRSSNSYDKFNEENNHQYVLEVNEEVVGFVDVGPTNDSQYSDCGELHAIYILKNIRDTDLGNNFLMLV